MSQQYDSIVLLRPDLTASMVEKVTSDISNSISECGAKLISHKYCGLRVLASDVLGNSKAHYIMFRISGLKNTLSEYKRCILLSEDVIRSMIFRDKNSSKELEIK